MTLAVGTRLGAYEIVSLLGAGGMGEVYRARDTRLERTVAIKVLPSHLSENAQLKQRFEREARTISALSHPHICTLHDIGHQEGIDYLVMEFLEGETLADRLKKGAMPAEQVLRYGTEIADALDRAHRQGIVHRDLKPGNIMLTKSGAKLLDFGLARMQPPPAQTALSGVSEMATAARQDITAEGTIVGTFQYMAPEQLEGKEADSRTDIFALGVVLYEMITGRRAFTGKSQASLIAAILEKEPQPIPEIQPMTPPALDRVVKTCMAKDPDNRWQSAHDLANELKWIREGSSHAGTPVPVKTRRRMKARIPWILAGLFFLTSLALGWKFLHLSSQSSEGLRVSVLPPKDTTVISSTISPDGKNLAIIAVDASARSALWLRPLDSSSARQLPDTQNAMMPFWSPDSRWIGFFADGKLKKIDLTGLHPVALTDVTEPRGGSWSRDGVIIFGSHQLIQRVSADGGQATAVTKLAPNEEADRWPCFLPDSRHFLYLGDAIRTEEHHLKVGSLDSLESTTLLGSVISSPAYARPGFILFNRQGKLMAQPFDADHLRLSGEPVPIAEHVALAGENHLFDFSVSDSGILTYRSRNPDSQLIWFDRNGNKLGTVGEPGRLGQVDLSPDEKRIAVEKLDADGRNGDIWILDLARATTTRFTFDPNWDSSPLWSPDGTQIAFASDRIGTAVAQNTTMYVKNSAGGGNDELILKSDSDSSPSGWSPDGRLLLFNHFRRDPPSMDIRMLRLIDHQVIPVLHTEFNESNGRLSPDGKWIAYVSDESGKPEVYVQSFPLSDAKWQISSGGGIGPTWRSDGKELFFLGVDNKLRSVEMKSGATLDPGIPRALFEVHTGVQTTLFERGNYAVSPDGQRILVNTVLEDETSGDVNLIFNWTSGLLK